MSNANNDLWSEFSDGEKEEDQSDNEPVLKKSAAKDGSEWKGAFDRRESPRDDSPDVQSGAADSE